MPFYFEEDPEAEDLRRVARESRVPVLVGTDQIGRGRPPKYYNGAVLVDAAGRSAASYQKMHLVPFGEVRAGAPAVLLYGAARRSRL